MTSSAPQHPLAPLVVLSDPKASERATRPGFILCLVVLCALPPLGMTVVAWAASTSSMVTGIAMAIPMLLWFGFLLFVTLQLAYTRGARSVECEVLTLDAAGLHADTPQGRVSLAWSDIASVSVRTRARHRIATFHLSPTAAPGAGSTVSSKTVEQLRKRGFQVGQAAIATPLDTVFAAARAFTGGRLVAG